MPLALFISFCACPSVSSSIFQSWLCVAYQYDGRYDNGASFHSYLRSDLRIRCSNSDFMDPEHDTITSIATALICVWPVGCILLFASALLPCRNSLHAHIQTPLTRATRFLTKDYTTDYFYWEVIELMRRSVLLHFFSCGFIHSVDGLSLLASNCALYRNLLVGWVLLIPIDKTFLRLIIAILVSLASLVLLLCVSPYRRAEDNVLAAGCQLALINSFIGAPTAITSN